MCVLSDILRKDKGTQLSWVWWHMPIISVLGRWRKKDEEFAFEEMAQ